MLRLLHPTVQVNQQNFEMMNRSQAILSCTYLLEDALPQTPWENGLNEFGDITEPFERNTHTMDRFGIPRIDTVDSLHHTAVIVFHRVGHRSTQLRRRITANSSARLVF